MVKSRLRLRTIAAILCLAAGAFGNRLSLQEHAAVQESLGRMPAKFHAQWLQRRGLDASRYTEYRRPETTGLVLRGKWGRGTSNEVTGRGNLVSLTLGSEVALLNVANPDSPVVLSEIQLNFIPAQSALHDSFLLTGGNGIEIWNIADSTDPKYRTVIPYAVSDFAVFDTLLYFSSGGTFYAYSIANASTPRQLGTCADRGDVASATRNVAVVRESSYVLGFIDVSNPAAPERAGTYPSFALAADARNTICCAEIYWQDGSEDQFRFEVLDISDPANVVRIGAVDSVSGWDIHLSGPIAFASGYQFPQWEFTIVDIQDSVHPQVISSCATPGGRFGVWSDWTSDRAYVADVIGMALVNTANLNSPVYDTTVLVADRARDVWLDQGHAYVADDEAGMRILDVSNPAAPIELGGIDTAYYGYFNVYAAVGHDSFAFAGWLPSPPLRIIDVIDPAHPKTVGGLMGLTTPTDMVLRDTLLFLAGRLRLHVVNVARPREPVLVGSCVTMDGTEFGLALQDTFAYMTSDYFQIVNIARPNSPFVVSTTNAGATGIAVRDTFAYIPYPNDTLWTFSVADPVHPRLLSSVPTSVWPKDVAFGESTLYVGTVDNHIDIFDIGNPGQPVRVGRTTAASDVNRLWYADGKLYAAIWNAGVAIYESTAAGIAEKPNPAERQGAFHVWPSVTGGSARFAVGGVVRQSDVAVYDISGKRLKDVYLRVYEKGGATEGEMGLAGQSSGVYVIRVNNEGTNLTAKVVKTKGE